MTEVVETNCIQLEYLCVDERLLMFSLKIGYDRYTKNNANASLNRIFRKR